MDEIGQKPDLEQPVVGPGAEASEGGSVPEAQVPSTAPSTPSTLLRTSSLGAMGGQMPSFTKATEGQVPAEKEVAETAAKEIINEGKKGSWWVWILVALLVLICGAIGYWLVKVNAGGILTKLGGSAPQTVTPLPSVTGGADKETEKLNQQGSSDETGAIEADLKASDYSNLSPELEQMEKELQ